MKTRFLSTPMGASKLGEFKVDWCSSIRKVCRIFTSMGFH
jgi:hypothetical protein